MTWFEELTGFRETTADEVRSKLILEDSHLTSLINQRRFVVGEFETPSLCDLRRIPINQDSKISVEELVGDAQSLHHNRENSNAVFQVASQFNCLEMAAPDAVPEDGVGIYQHDRTQGPACSIAAGAGTVYRNYFAEVNGRLGQTRDNQIDCLSKLEEHFGRNIWRMENGYCFPSPEGLSQLEQTLGICTETELDSIRGLLRVGIQSNTQVTLRAASHLVTQVFCSALPIAYSDIGPSKWNHFPRLILDATYEATFLAAAQNAAQTGCNKLYLTLVGGGVFGNCLDWILDAIRRSLKLFAYSNLSVFIVSYGRSNPKVAELAAAWNP